MYLRVRRAVMVEGMSIREAAREFGLHRDTVRKMLAYSGAAGLPAADSAPQAHAGALYRGHRPDPGIGGLQRLQEAAPHGQAHL